MRITLLGATGKTGMLVLEQALAAGYEVNALTRHADVLFEKPGLRVYVGSATNLDDVVSASEGSDIIVSTLGTKKLHGSTLMTDAVTTILAAYLKTHVQRCIIMSTALISDNPSKGILRLLARVTRSIFKDKVKSEALLRASNLDWTIVYPTILTTRSRGYSLREVGVHEKLRLTQSIPRAAVASWIIGEIRQYHHKREAVVISA